VQNVDNIYREREKALIGVDRIGEVWYNTHMKTTTTKREYEGMSFFEAVARRIMKQHEITTHRALVSALQQAGYARFAAIRTADKVFDKPRKMA
jgi:hypothetical protein